MPLAEPELSPCEYGEARKDDDVEDISKLDDLFWDYDWCYECQGYGDDYYFDENGEVVSFYEWAVKMAEKEVDDNGP